VLDFKCNQCNRCFAKIESLNQHQQATGHLPSSILSPSAPLTVHGNRQNDQDPLDVILNGIEAIKQHYSKQLLRNN
jgi:hypothetical protein